MFSYFSTRLCIAEISCSYEPGYRIGQQPCQCETDEKIRIACKESGEAVSDHFLHLKEMIPGGKGAKRPYPTVHLSRFACYLLVKIALTGQQCHSRGDGLLRL